MDQFDYLCAANMSLWLHIYYSWLFLALIPVSSSVFLIYLHIWEILYYRYSFDYDERDLEEPLNTVHLYHNVFRNFIKILMTEIKLTFVYIVGALFWTYTLNIGLISQMRIIRWLIEGFYAPMSIFILWYLYFVYYSGEHIYTSDLTCYTSVTSIIKLIIFIFSRYIELYPSSRLNQIPMEIFYRMCNNSIEHRIPENDFVQLLNNNKTAIG